jgi:hypothetical protein
MNRVLATLTHSETNNLGTLSIPYRSFFLEKCLHSQSELLVRDTNRLNNETFFPAWEYFAPRLGIKNSQTGNQLRHLIRTIASFKRTLLNNKDALLPNNERVFADVS